MSIYIPLQNVPVQFEDTNGNPLTSGTLEFYLSGTATPTNLYSDSSGTSIGSSITLNTAGYPESGGNVITLFRDMGVALKIIAKNSAGTIQWTADELETGAFFGHGTDAKTAAYTVTVADRGKIISFNPSQDVVVALPAAASAGDGFPLGITNLSNYILRLDGNATETINGETAQYIMGGGSAILACDGTGWVGILDKGRSIAFKSADTARSSTTTLADDAHLVGLSLPRNSTWCRFEAFLTFTSSSATPDAKFALSFSETVQEARFSVEGNDASAAITFTTDLSSAVVIPIGAGTVSVVTVRGYILPFSGDDSTVSLQWAQNASNATSVTLERGSWMMVEQL